MSFGGVARARSLLDAGRYKEAAETFIAAGELASAARAFVAAKDFFRAAVCYEKALKPLDAARLYQQIRRWSKAAELYAAGGDMLRAEAAREQLKKEQEDASLGKAGAWAHAPVGSRVPTTVSAAVESPTAPPEPNDSWPPGEIWGAIRAGDAAAAVTLYLRAGTRSGWELITEAKTLEALKALAEIIFEARDYAVAAEAFQKAGEMLRSAQCLSLAGLNEEAAHTFINLGEKAVAAQHLEKAQAFELAAALYLQEELFLDAARCHEKDDDPVRAAAMYLKAKMLDLALPLLQSVSPSHRSYAACRLLAGKILLQKGRKDLAIALLAPLLEAVPQSEEGLESYYQAAILMEQAGAADRARAAYQTLQETSFGFKDVTGRLQKLPLAGSPAAAPVAPAISLPSSAAAPAPPKAETALPEMDLSPLRDCSLFNRLGNEDLRRIWMIGKSGECKPGKVILKQGEVAAGLMVVLSGGITITPDPANTSLASGFLGPGDYVGLGCLLKGPPQPNALVAQAGTRLLVLPLGALETLLSAEAEMGLRFYRSVAEHLVQTLMAGKARPSGA